MNRPSLSDQIADRCINFTGIMNEKCEAGVEYSTVKTEEGFPCVKNRHFTAGHCDQCIFPNSGMVKKLVNEIEEICGMSTKARALIVRHINDTGNEHGSIKCPACEDGKLNYTRASENNHIWAKCKCGLGWME